MYTLAIILIVLLGLGNLVWVGRHVMISRQKRTGFALTPESPGPPEAAPKITVVVAAKDEQENIEACVRTMLAQDYPDFEMIVADDRSSDRTGEIVAAIAREDPRLKLVTIDHLPAGWSGKNHAMMHGIAASGGEWICMIDADCRQTSNRTLSVAMQHALDTGSDMLSVLPTLEMQGFWENVVQPVCGGVMMIWFHPDKVNNPAKRNAYANGAFILMRRSAYEAVGTHEVVKQCLMEDMHMSKKLKDMGMRLRVVQNFGLYLVRMYTSLGAILRGWSRIFLGTFGTPGRLCTSAALVLAFSLLPHLGALAGLILALAGAAPVGLWPVVAATGAAAAILQISAIYRFYRLIGGRTDLAWTFPIGAVLALVALLMSISRLRPGAKVVWRGTTYTAVRS
ncbi:MAG: 4,4'-diaponeurosporenoate glycosyltransferase [Planctomycetes bacterium ADurb.Bin126]|nr:MAG: 4,4'-diaponeurosporenoate glycosyltransferase [Planctomycetes bacterium ADurb.Bin126]HOD80085.1 glycosyltransferase family 2 protein [Phycisphaerae bacterium]HQL74499.1 glycosyltransferase family 2 protein [Phycisphaerae bacterium]